MTQLFDNFAAFANKDSGAPVLKNDYIVLAMMSDNSVDTAELVDSAVETAKINDLAVETAKIDTSAVTIVKLNKTQGSFTTIQGAQATHFTVHQYAFASPLLASNGSNNGQINEFKFSGWRADPLGVTSYRQWYIDKGAGSAGSWTITWDYML